MKNRHIWRYALWPVSVWISIREFSKHGGDDSVELSSPILASAVAFWGALAGIAFVWFTNGALLDFQLLLWFTPIIYAVGLGFYITRERAYEQSDA
ncbi:MAG: hypothetical protein AB7G04_09050 [Hyphomonadaceae bacterium]